MKLKKVAILILIMSLLLQAPICSIAEELGVDSDLSSAGTEETTKKLMDNKQNGKVSQDGGGAGKFVSNFAKSTGNTALKTMQTMSSEDEKDGSCTSIEAIVYNQVELFDINFFSDIDENASDKDWRQLIKINIRKWYNELRNLSIGLSLVVLVYIGIRMVISSTGEARGKYKKMITYWVTSFILLFVLQYIMIGIIALSNQMVKLIEKGKTGYVNSQMEKLLEQINSDEFTLFENKGELVTKYTTLENFQAQLEESTFEGLLLDKVFKEDGIAGIIIFCALVFYTAKFFIMYFRRMLTVAFLIIISPIITITYALDKIGDTKAQAFDKWLKEFIINVVIQPIHAILYTVFIFSAIYVAGKAPMLAVIFFALLSRGEKIARKVIFQKFSGGSVLGSLEKTLPVKRR